MGEALITRRGGSVKTGYVDAQSIHASSIQCDDWVGAKNIILTCVCSIDHQRINGVINGELSSPDGLDLLVLEVRVANGRLVEGLCSSVDSEYGYEECGYTHLWFDSTTGTIGSDTGEWFAHGALNGAGDNYYYVVY